MGAHVLNLRIGPMIAEQRVALIFLYRRPDFPIVQGNLERLISIRFMLKHFPDLISVLRRRHCRTDHFRFNT